MATTTGIASLTFSHFSKAESITPYSVEQTSKEHFKPRGLWLSVDGEDDWLSWCESEQFGIGANRFRVKLTDGPLLLSTVDEVRQFDREFGNDRDRYFVDWVAVAARWPGIIIAPYQWPLRLSDVSWYYPWDCASGCIWDASVVTSVERINEQVSA